MKTLSIIIPYHNEDVSLLYYPMSSLNTQVGVDWSDVEIIISNNCEKPKDIDNWLKQFEDIYPSIRYVECPVKKGMGQNRQYGLSISTGKYAMFSDSDDTLLSPLSLKTILDEVYTDKYNLISGGVIREVVERGVNTSTIADMGPNTLLLHGKAYRKNFLIENGIHFSHWLFAYEDFYFNLLATTFASVFPDKYKILTDGLYTWRAREDSISSEMGSDNYTTLYYKDSILYIYYAARHVLDYVPDKEYAFSFHHNCLFNIYRGRMASPSQDEFTIAVAAMICKYCNIDKKALQQEAADLNIKVSTVESLSDWINRVLEYDITGAEEKFGIEPYKKFMY
jgi:glycosyltransferase involved in cell wall biosynthesis